MRAKILFLSEKEKYRESLRMAQQALSELAVAFSHSFVMREMSLEAYDNQQELLSLMLEQDAVLMAGSKDFAKKTALSLGCFAAASRINQSDTLKELSRLKEGNLPSADLIYPLHDSPSFIGKTAVAACAHAKKGGSKLVTVQNDGTESWNSALSKAAMYAALPSPQSFQLDAVLEQLLYNKECKPLVVSGANEASMIGHLLLFLGGTELLAYVTYLADCRRIQGVSPYSEQPQLPFFSMLYATAEAVRYSIGLEEEAGCLEAAINNVLASGWRTPEFGLSHKTIAQEEALRLIVQQVQLAGELFERLQ